MTAVEWLMEQITFDSDGERQASYKECCDLKEYFQQALIMEKEQILKAYDKGYDDVDVYEPEKYFNETYKK